MMKNAEFNDWPRADFHYFLLKSIKLLFFSIHAFYHGIVTVMIRDGSIFWGREKNGISIELYRGQFLDKNDISCIINLIANK